MEPNSSFKNLILTILASILIYSCTSNLFVVKGKRNAIKTEQNVKADSMSVKINN